MTDREKVIKGIDICLQRFRCGEDCPYYNVEKIGCMEQLREDALALLKEQEQEIENLKQTAQSMMEGVCLLKEQEAVKPVRDELTGRMWLCGKCGSYVGFEDNDPYDPNEFDKYCSECGRPVLWEGR